MKIKLVFLTDCLADLQGGAERQIYELASRLDKTKYEVTIASLECEGRAPREIIESAGCRLRLFPVKRIYGLSGIWGGFRFIRFLRKEKVDILMTYHFSSDIWGTVCGRLAGIKVIISNRRDMGFWRKPWHIWAYRLMNRWVDKILVNANAIKTKFTAEEGLPPGKVEVIYNGVEIQDTRHKTQDASLRTEFGIKENDLVIMHVAALTSVKGHEFLIRAFAQLISMSFNKFPAVSNFKLILIGDGELREDLQQLAGSLGLWGSGSQSENKVIFLGKRNDVRDLLNIADICVLPSLSEGFSNAILEYMASGKPVIATKVGGNVEIIENGVDGLLVKEADVSTLAEAMLYLLQRRDMAIMMGKSGQEMIRERFSMQKMIGVYQDIFLGFTGNN